MSKLSVLIFSRNYAEKVISLIKDIYDIADEVILIDSSDKIDSGKLYKAKEANKFNKLRIFYVVALGYPDPLRMWALKKCKYEWVLLLDTDERPNNELKSNINTIISHAHTDAFAIRRYEEVRKDGTKTNFFTWQIRLFKKDKTLFKGILHEQPEIKGTLSRLENKSYYIQHFVDMQALSSHEYSNIEKFERFSYKEFNNKILEYAIKFKMPEGRTANNSILGRFLKKATILYEKLTFKRPDQEVSNFDYFVLQFIRNLTYGIKARSIRNKEFGIFGIFPKTTKYMKRMKRWRNEPGSDENFEVSKIINRVGITKFLDLDNDKTIKMLNKKYANQNQGIDLLTKLLKEKYRSTQDITN